MGAKRDTDLLIDVKRIPSSGGGDVVIRIWTDFSADVVREVEGVRSVYDNDPWLTVFVDPRYNLNDLLHRLEVALGGAVDDVWADAFGDGD